MGSNLGFVHDYGDADEIFRSALKLRVISTAAIEKDAIDATAAALKEAKLMALSEEETAQLVRDCSDNRDLLALLDESLFLKAHACFEFTLVQLSDQLAVIEKRDFKPPKGDRAFLETVALKIGELGGVSDAFNSDGWKQVLILARVRNAIAHAMSYQDREFSNDDLDFLSRLGFGSACRVDRYLNGQIVMMPPIFFLKDAALQNVVKLYRDLLNDLVSRLDASDAHS